MDSLSLFLHSNPSPGPSTNPSPNLSPNPSPNQGDLSPNLSRNPSPNQATLAAEGRKLGIRVSSILPYTSPISPISPIRPLYLPYLSHISPLSHPYISPWPGQLDLAGHGGHA